MEPIYKCPLTQVLILEILVVNTCAETKIASDYQTMFDNISFIYISLFHCLIINKQYVCLLYEQYILKPNSIKPFNNIIHIEFYGLSLYQHLPHCNIIQDISLTHSS